KLGVTAMDIAKRLLDLGFYAPSTYFPLIVEEALMIEPTETESKETLDQFCDAMIQIAREAETSPDVIHQAPLTTPVRRLDQTLAPRQPVLRWGPARWFAPGPPQIGCPSSLREEGRMRGDRRMTAPFRLLVPEPLDGALNMALDESLLRGRLAGTTTPTLRFFAWQPPTISLGYGQPLDAPIHDAAAPSPGSGAGRRP